MKGVWTIQAAQTQRGRGVRSESEEKARDFNGCTKDSRILKDDNPASRDAHKHLKNPSA